MFHIRYDGSVTDEDGFAVLGGETDAIRERLENGFSTDVDKAAALKHAVKALSGDKNLESAELEVGLLSRAQEGRCFERLENGQIAELLS